MNGGRLRAARGFTLVEVLVALALVATVLGGVLTLARGAATNQAHLEQRLLAYWVADNVLAQFRLERPPLPASGELRGQEVQLGRAFDYRLRVSESASGGTAPATLELHVEVHAAGAPTALAVVHERMPRP